MIDEINKIRKTVKELGELGFNLFSNGEFIEFYISKILNGKRSGHQSHYDIEMPDGKKIEVKLSTELFQNYRTYIKSYYDWFNLRGSGKTFTSKDGCVDFIILCGYSINHGFSFWVIPYQKVIMLDDSVNKAKRVHYRLSKKRNEFQKRGRGVWIEEFFVGGESSLIEYFNER